MRSGLHPVAMAATFGLRGVVGAYGFVAVMAVACSGGTGDARTKPDSIAAPATPGTKDSAMPAAEETPFVQLAFFAPSHDATLDATRPARYWSHIDQGDSLFVVLLDTSLAGAGSYRLEAGLQLVEWGDEPFPPDADTSVRWVPLTKEVPAETGLLPRIYGGVQVGFVRLSDLLSMLPRSLGDSEFVVVLRATWSRPGARPITAQIEMLYPPI